MLTLIQFINRSFRSLFFGFVLSMIPLFISAIQADGKTSQMMPFQRYAFWLSLSVVCLFWIETIIGKRMYGIVTSKKEGGYEEWSRTQRWELIQE
jgi:hypothetical protein